MIIEYDAVMAGAGFPDVGVGLGAPSNDDFPEVSFEEAVARFRYWKYMSPDEIHSLSFHQHAWRREYLRKIKDLERKLRTVF